jgi:polar amino acid transport system substrate-binding protein
MICEELKVACTIQMRRFDTLIDALSQNRGDAVMASIAVTPETRKRVDFSDPYYRTPARFAARRELQMAAVRPELLEGKKVGVVAGTAHEAYLKAMFTEAEFRLYATPELSREALKRGDVDLLFGDVETASHCLSGSTAQTRTAVACCAAVHSPRAAISAKGSASP